MAQPPTYAIAGSHLVFRRWLWQDPQARKDVRYLNTAMAKQLLRRGAPKGTLIRLEGWEESPARKLAEQLELLEDV